MDSFYKIVDAQGNEVNYFPDPIKSESSELMEPMDKLHVRKQSSKFIGFLEELSNEEGSSDEEVLPFKSEDEKAKSFLRKIYDM